MAFAGPGSRQVTRSAGFESAGVPLERARGAMLLFHGRGATASSILTLVPEIEREGFVFLAPQAPGGTWYPQSFLAPLAENEPWLSASLEICRTALAHIADAGIGPEHTILLGFSQGGCLASEYAARNARRYGGLVVLSGGLVGPPGTPRGYSGSLARTPIFLGCSDVDPHVPRWRVEESAMVLSKLGGTVDARIYPGLGHTINSDEINQIRSMTAQIA